MQLKQPVQVPRWQSDLSQGIKTKFKDFTGGWGYKKVKFTGPSQFSTWELNKIYV